ncbi:nucleotidyltransferase domain-containing protein [Burkholderiaceae bacterium DAT-1]|nr:nucleotidyltransferase domain-containing protein [Burkholderiaceae bacterium DAT-1]
MMMRDKQQRGTRELIAEVAARLMAQGHIDDFSLAKRKAARQLGLPEHQDLPGNSEIEQALKRYRDLYDPGHVGTLTRLRELALEVMHVFAQFRPYLVGSVLSGRANRHSDINLVVYSDNLKSFELFCLNQRIDYQMQGYADGKSSWPVFVFDAQGTTIKVAVRPEREERIAVKGGVSDIPERIRASQLEALLHTSVSSPL